MINGFNNSYMILNVTREKIALIRFLDQLINLLAAIVWAVPQVLFLKKLLLIHKLFLTIVFTSWEVDFFLALSFFPVPGKPPTNLTAKALSPSRVRLSWTFPHSNSCEIFPILNLRVFYTQDIENVTMTRSSDVNRTTNHIVIQHLEHFEFYFIWLQTLTTHGLGPKSKEVKIRTLEKG